MAEESKNEMLKRSMIYVGDGDEYAFGVGSKTLKFEQWVAIFSTQAIADRFIADSSLFKWGEPYKDQGQGKPAEGED